MKITVATVCYNCADTIEQTIKSVINQTYNNIEYIIIDGASKDNTIEIVRKYEKENGILVVSEPDKGLYDAMNKAADLSTGDYILYMNSGDVFAADTVIEEMMPYLLNNHDMVYGNVIRIKSDGEHLEKYKGKFKKMQMALEGKMMSHQSMFTKTDIMKKYRFNLDFSITADYDLFLRMMHDKLSLYYADITVSIVENMEGISSLSQNIALMRKQDDISLRRNFPFGYYVMFLPKYVYRIITKY